jgi:hypothetical protein
LAAELQPPSNQNQKTYMKQQTQMHKWIPLAVLSLALAGSAGMAATAPDIIPTPGAMQPGGDPTDTTLNWGTWWNGDASVTETFDTTTQSSNNIAGSIYVVVDCPGGTASGTAANLAFGNFLQATGNNGWLGAGTEFDASKYESMTMDIKINTAVSSNTPIPINLYGYSYENVALTNLPATTPGWHHVVIPIPSAISLSDWTAYGVYDWYSTTATTPEAHVEYWFDNLRFVARPAPPPPPTLSLEAVTQLGLMFDSGPGEGGNRGAIDTVQNVSWAGYPLPGSPVTYSMTIGWVPDPAIYPNYEAHIFLAPSAGVGSPDWNLSDMGYLQILDNSDGTATAKMMWKTNDAMDNTMLFNAQFGGPYGTNGLAAGTLGSLHAPAMLGTWSIAFTSDTNFTVSGPGGVSTNLSLPADWLASLNGVNAGSVFAYFGGGPNGNANAGQPMFLSNVAVTGGILNYTVTNDFSTLPLDTTTWALLGNESLIVLPPPGWFLHWTIPAVNFDLMATADLSNSNGWVVLTGNTNLAAAVTPYAWGTNMKVLVATADLPSTHHTYFTLRKLVATQLQVLMPGETNAPGTAKGKIGTPASQSTNSPVNVTVNAVDANWNIVDYCADTVAITSSDTAAILPNNAALAKGTGTFVVTFSTTGPQTVTATDATQSSVAANTGSPTTITP